MEEFEVIVRKISDGGGCATAFLIVVVLFVIGIPMLLIESCVNGAFVTSDQAVDGGSYVEQNSSQSAYLAELSVFSDHSNIISNITSRGTVSDSYGNTYDAPYFDLCSYGDAASNGAVQAYTDIETGGKYSTLEGTYFCRSKQAAEFTICFRIYADGNLVYDSGYISKATKATHFNVSIQNADIVRVISYSDDYTQSGTNPGIVLVDAIVHK